VASKMRYVLGVLGAAVILSLSVIGGFADSRGQAVPAPAAQLPNCSTVAVGVPCQYTGPVVLNGIPVVTTTNANGGSGSTGSTGSSGSTGGTSGSGSGNGGKGGRDGDGKGHDGDGKGKG